MKLYILFHHYDDDPRLMPNAVAIMDEYTMDEVGYGHWKDDCDEAKRDYGPGAYREAIIAIPEKSVRALFEAQAINGHIEGS